MVLTILVISGLLVVAAIPQPPTFLAHVWKDTQRAFSNGLCLLLFNYSLDWDTTTLRTASLGRVGSSCPSPCTSSPRGQLRTMAGDREEVSPSDMWTRTPLVMGAGCCLRFAAIWSHSPGRVGALAWAHPQAAEEVGQSAFSLCKTGGKIGDILGPLLLHRCSSCGSWIRPVAQKAKY